MSNIVSALKEHARKENGKGIMTLKLALLYMLYGVLLVSGPAKKLDEKYIYLVDNLKAFNAYPWDRISYEFIVSDIRSCMSDRVQNFWKRKEKKKTEKKKDHNVEKFDVSGFTHVLQVWEYEVMPELGKLCAKRVSGSTDATPRILRWIAEDAPTAEFLKKNIFFNLKSGDLVADREQAAAVAANEDLDENVDVDASTTRRMRTREERTKNRHDVDAGKPLVHKVGCKEVESDDEEESVGGEEESESDDSDYKEEEASDDNEQEESDDKEEEETHEADEEGQEVMGHHISPKNKNRKTQKNVGEEDQSESVVGRYDPSASYPVEKLHYFNEWWATSQDIVTLVAPLSFDVDWVVSPSWFTPLITPRAWLNNAQRSISLGKRLIATQKKNEELDFQHEGGTILQYVGGRCPKELGSKWAECDKNFGVAHVFGNHWVLYELDLTMCTIMVYDSLSDTTTIAKTKKEFVSLARALPIICNMGNIWEGRTSPEDVHVDWKIARMENPPQQTNGSDCGVLAIKFMEALAAGRSVAEIDPGMTIQFRQRFCSELFKSADIVVIE
ncbi:hypothetical protein DH2020_028185 [Rehmannia glutinosa]|uniref:Ubiquitin-like protease family profile domain-containing protein n=1 Tax=Rehmannia glutinosa TaxID=99300 RepID=A0ABR0VW78_REHGL